MTTEGIREEYRSPTYDIVGKLRARRLKWAGQLLRKEPGTSMARDVLEKTVMNLQEKGKYSLLMDAPDFES